MVKKIWSPYPLLNVLSRAGTNSEVNGDLKSFNVAAAMRSKLKNCYIWRIQTTYSYTVRFEFLAKISRIQQLGQLLLGIISQLKLN